MTLGGFSRRLLRSHRSTIRAMSTAKPKAVFLNASRLDYDGALDFSRLHTMLDLTLHPEDIVRDQAEILSLVQDQEIVFTKEMLIPAETFSKFPKSVKVLMEVGTGYNNLPVCEARAAGIPVCNIPTYSTDAVAHMAICYLMNLSVSMFDQQRMLLQNDRSNFTGPFTLPLHELTNATVGIVGGTGRIGTKVGEICLALGMKVILSSRKGVLPNDHALYGKVECTSNVNCLLQQSDYVSLHTPLNDQTRGSFGRQQIEQMKPTAFLINTSRGAVCNEAELVECLQEKVIAGAGLDVTATEPPAPDSKLWDLDNCWLTPHTGWRRVETRQRSVNMVADNVEAYCAAKSEADMINVVN
jgi:glycerate dehydrogenase